MLRLTARRQNITVMTVSTLRKWLEDLSRTGRKFSIVRVRRDRVWIHCDYTAQGKGRHATVVLPAYPTGSAEDEPSNNWNVVLDPLEFEGAKACEEREVFATLLGHEVLAHYEKMHPTAVVPVSRCC